MANNVKTVFQWLNNDSTADLNKKFATVFYKGITSGGLLNTVALELSVIVNPYEAMTDSGLLLVSDQDYKFTNIPLNQMTVLTIFGKWMQGDDSIVEYRMYEINEYNSLTNKGDHVVFGTVTLGSSNIQVVSTDISYDLRDVFDKLGRSSFRGILSNAIDLPASNNRENDFYSVGGGGGLVEIYAWNGNAWLNITNSLAFQDELTNHRNNAYANEKHLTDDEKDAVLGTYGIPSNSNKFVTNQDTRLPTQDENDALVGSDGSASSTNKYITQEFPLAETNYLIYPLAPGTISLLSILGKYVGNGGIDSANAYFSLLDIGVDRGYINSSGLFPKIVGIWKDPLLTSKLNPSVDADSYGFYDDDLYITVDNVIDTGIRLAYGQKKTLKAIDKGFNLRKGPNADWVSGEARQFIQDIKGRDYDVLIPEDEKNINLRSDIYELISYLGSNQKISIVSGKEDYEYFKSNANLSPYFVENENISYVYNFQNTSLISFTYNYSTGIITYAGSPSLTSVVSGNLFRDGLGNFFKITNKTSNTVTIVDIATNIAPISVNTSVSTSLDGAIFVNNNPRNVLTNELKVFANEKIKCDTLVELEELSIPEGRQAFGIAQDSKRINPNIVFYGSWENHTGADGKTYIRNSNGIGDIQITGFLSEVYLLCKPTAASPTLGISLNCEQISSVVDISQGGLVNSTVSTIDGHRYTRILIKDSLVSSALTTVNMRIQAATADPLVIYGLELVSFPSINPTVSNEVLVEGGVGFKSAKLIKKSANEVIQIPAVNRFGVNYQLTLDKDVNNNAIYSVINTPTPEIDYYPSYPTSSSFAGANYVVSDSNARIFKVNDIIQLIGSTRVDLRKIISISGTTYTFDAAPYSENKQFRLLCSLGDDTPFESYNSYAAKYSIVSEFVNGSSTDFSATNAGSLASRYVVHRDGQTILGAKYATANTDSISIAQTTGSLDIGVFGPKMAIGFNNATAVTIQVSIDGSSYYDLAIPAGKVRKTIFSKGRNTFHEVHIKSSTSTFSVTDIVLFTIERGNIGDATLIATIDNVSPYYQSLALDEFTYRQSSGKIFYDAYHHGLFLNGTDVNTKWSLSDVTQFLGRCTSTQNGGDSFNFSFTGEGFDIYCLTGADAGKCKVYVDGALWNTYSATIIGSTDSYIDLYNSTQGVKIFTMYGLDYKTHKVNVVMDNPRSKNPASTGFNFGIFGYSVLSSGGRLRNTYNNASNIYTPVWDSREFSSAVESQLTLVQSTSSGSGGSTSTVPSVILYVDRNRTDTYVEDGTIFTPFKTLDSAINYINANPAANGYSINLSTGSYSISVAAALPTSLHSINGSPSTISSYIYPSTVSCNFNNLNINAISDSYSYASHVISNCTVGVFSATSGPSTFTIFNSNIVTSNIKSPCFLYNCNLTGVCTIQGGTVKSYNSTFNNVYMYSSGMPIVSVVSSAFYGYASAVSSWTLFKFGTYSDVGIISGDAVSLLNLPAYSSLTATLQAVFSFVFLDGSSKISVPAIDDLSASDLTTTLTSVYSRAKNNLVTPNFQTASYILALTDSNKNVLMNVASANTLTVPTDATVNFSIGTCITVTQWGAGATTIVAASGATVNSEHGLILNARYAAASLTKVAANTWLLAGSLRAV